MKPVVKSGLQATPPVCVAESSKSSRIVDRDLTLVFLDESGSATGDHYIYNKGGWVKLGALPRIEGRLTSPNDTDNQAIMDFIQNAAGKYMKEYAGGGAAPAESTGGGVDWSNLSSMAQQFGKADQTTSGELDASTFKKFLGGFGGSGGKIGHTEATPNEAVGEKPPGYPTTAGPAPDTNVINQLLGHFEKDTGEKFKGEERQYSILEEIAYRVTGQRIPAPILKKMISWKLKGLV